MNVTTTTIKCNGLLCISSAKRYNAIETISRVLPSGNVQTIAMCERCSTCAQEVWENLTITVI